MNADELSKEINQYSINFNMGLIPVGSQLRSSMRQNELKALLVEITDELKSVLHFISMPSTQLKSESGGNLRKAVLGQFSSLILIFVGKIKAIRALPDDWNMENAEFMEQVLEAAKYDTKQYESHEKQMKNLSSINTS